MTQLVTRNWPALTGIVAAAVLIAALLPLIAAPDEPDRVDDPREIVLLARGMQFVGRGGGDVNPEIRMTAGERVRLVLVNESSGIRHDVAVPAWDVAVDLVSGGETAVVTFTVPDRPGRYEYLCRPHARMMRGIISVEQAVGGTR